MYNRGKKREHAEIQGVYQNEPAALKEKYLLTKLMNSPVLVSERNAPIMLKLGQVNSLKEHNLCQKSRLRIKQFILTSIKMHESIIKTEC